MSLKRGSPDKELIKIPIPSVRASGCRLPLTEIRFVRKIFLHRDVVVSWGSEYNLPSSPTGGG